MLLRVTFCACGPKFGSNPGQVVHACTSVTMQCNLVPSLSTMSVLFAGGKVTIGLMSHCPWVSDSVNGLAVFSKESVGRCCRCTFCASFLMQMSRRCNQGIAVDLWSSFPEFGTTYAYQPWASHSHTCLCHHAV